MVTRYGFCKVCHNQFYYTSETWNGRPRAYCDLHAEEHRKKAINNRVKRHRKANADRAGKLIIHIGVDDLNKTYCGLSLDHMYPKNVLEKFGEDDMVTCERCKAVRDRLVAEMFRVN